MADDDTIDPYVQPAQDYRDVRRAGGMLARGAGGGGMLPALPLPSEKIEQRIEDKRSAEAMMPIFERKMAAEERLMKRQEELLDRPQPELKQQRVREPPPQDLGQNAMMWVAAASALGGLAGLASRRGSINALNAFSGALDGLAKGDILRYRANYEHWKAETDAINKNNDAEMREYESAIKRRDLDQKQITALIEMSATKHRNEMMRQVAAHAMQTGDFETVAVLADATEGQYAQFAIHKKEIEAANDRFNERMEQQERLFELRQSRALAPQEDEASLRMRAQEAWSGNQQSAWRGVSSFSPNAPRLQQMITEEGRRLYPDKNPQELAQILAEKTQQYQGGVSGQRIASGIGTRVEFATGELEGVAENALAASEKLPRSKYRSFNEFAQAAQREFSDPNFLSFQEFHQTLINAYARAMQPLGVTTVYAQMQAKELLERSTSAEGYRAQIEAMFKNIDSSRASIARLQGRQPPPAIMPPEKKDLPPASYMERVRQRAQEGPPSPLDPGYYQGNPLAEAGGWLMWPLFGAPQAVGRVLGHLVP
jgi:hypothetical protein